MNERDTIAALVGRLVATRLVETIVVVDDGSDDGTVQVLEDLGNRWPRLVIRRRPTRKGIGSALREGFALALAVSPASRFAQLDADLSHSPESLEDLMQCEADVVIGSRYVPGGKVVGLSLRRRAISHGANGLSRLLLHLPVRDATSGFRLYSRRAAESIVSGTLTTGFEFFVESVLVAQQRHFSFAEAHITFVGREAGHSKFGREDILDFLRFLVKAGTRHGISSKRRDT